ncbi:MAG TPA: hypothetical protein VF989_12985 [Polyangiaceae bacterium]|jgi:hypothetical protein
MRFGGSPARTGGLGALAAAFFLVLVAGCREQPSRAVLDESEPSPNASILPAPLASVVDPRRRDAGADAATDAGPEGPVHPAYDEPLPGELALGVELLGATLKADLRWPLGPTANRRSPSLLDLTIELTATGRARLVVSSETFVLPAGTELHARRELWGELLLWPGGSAYRLLAPGTLRALFGEGRADALPLLSPRIEAGEAGELLGFPTESVKVSTAFGSAEVERAAIPALTSGGQLVCRMLLELVGVEPESPACAAAVPLRVRFDWAAGGALVFEVRSLTRRQDLPERAFLMPPNGSRFEPQALPIGASARILGKRGQASNGTGAALQIQNSLDTLAYVAVDGALSAWLGPSQTLAVNTGQAGRVRVAWYDWYGAPLGSLDGVVAPGRLILGTAEAGAPETPTP